MAVENGLTGRSGPFRVGVGGPVGSGKTALIEALVPLAIAHGHRPLVITNDIFTNLDAEHVRATLAGVLDPERVIGVETGSCPHTAVRDDPTMNLAAMEELVARFPRTGRGASALGARPECGIVAPSSCLVAAHRLPSPRGRERGWGRGF